MGAHDKDVQEIDIGKTPYGYFLDFNGERLITSNYLKEVFERLDEEIKKAFGIPVKEKKKGLFRKK